MVLDKKIGESMRVAEEGVGIVGFDQIWRAVIWRFGDSLSFGKQ